MGSERTHTTLTGSRRCAYCGYRCHGRTCEFHADLLRVERAAVTTPKLRQHREPRFRATCGKCGEIASRGSWNCQACGTSLYLRAAVKRR